MRRKITGLFADHGVLRMPRVGSGQEVSRISRVGSSRVERFSNLAGRVMSGQEFFKSHGPGRVVSIIFKS